ncbi:MAG: hypothetical protein KKA07_05480 [Bacteroidetes bacterium]|nr:hypothetical protein [Bacteroidota bacterium]MBU1718505.1 hypothetical protein [Bacteroidota bacterium]
MNTKTQQEFEAGNIIKICFKRWRLISVIVLGAAISAFVFSGPYFIPPKYKSTVVLFPTATSSISKALISSSPSVKEDILELGDEDRVDQLLQILNADEIRDQIIRRHNLLEHYGIDPDSRYKMTKLHNRFEENITFRRTRFLSVEIEVLDTDPNKAASIANDIADLIDSVTSRMQKERAIEGFRIVDAQYKSLIAEIEKKEAVMAKLRLKGVYEYEKQVEVISEQLAIALAKNNVAGAKALQNQLDTLGIYGGDYVSNRDNVIYEREKLAELKIKFYEAKVDAEEIIPQKFVVSRAYPAERKSYPVRWIVVLISGLSAAFLTILFILFYDRFRYPRKQFN